MSANDTHPADGQDALAHYGKAAILVPLIIGGALLVAAAMMWHAHNRRARLAEATRVEEKLRHELRAAYVEMRGLRPAAALEHADAAKALLDKLPVALAPDYADLKVARLLVEGESLFMLDCAEYAAIAETRFDEALHHMNYASGEMWLFGMLGRARARYEMGRFEQALADVEAVMDRNDSFGAAYYWRSLIRAKLDDPVGARDDERRARALDSWPPLRDFMQASCQWTRDILAKPECRTSAAPLVEIFAEP